MKGNFADLLPRGTKRDHDRCPAGYWPGAGETAPLLFTGPGNLNWSLSLTKPMASLPATIYQYAGSAFEDRVQLAWAGALLITVGVPAINIIARIALRGRG